MRFAIRRHSVLVLVPVLRLALLFLLPTLLLAACGEGEPAPSGSVQAVADAAESSGAPAADGRNPRHDLLETLRDDLAAERHPSDGGGRAWLEAPDEPATASVPGTWTLHYEAGPAGVAPGGVVYLQISPFWGWSTPQTDAPSSPGYTEVSASVEGLEFDARTLDQQLLGVEIGEPGLAPGDRLELRYGAGPAGARADRFAERGERFWIAVDGDGDGVRGLLAEPPEIDVLPGPPARLVALLPSTVSPGDTARLTLAVLDARGSARTRFEGEMELERWPPKTAGEAGAGDGDETDGAPALEGLPRRVRFRPADEGVRHVEIVPRGTGIARLRVTSGGANIISSFGGRLEAVTNPMQVAAAPLRVLWGDLQNHSNVSDGTGRPEDLIRYARDVAALDVVSVTDHDHWGLRFLDQDPETWRRILEVTEELHEPGRFVTVPGFEWTNWIHGHRHVLFFDAADARLVSSVDPATDHPEELWEALDGLDAMTVAHHSAGGPIATDWSIAPPRSLEPVTEIVSVHGASEAPDAPRSIYRPVEGNFVRDALARGYRFGFLGSSDGHDGHPGLGHLASPSGGLAAILSSDATRAGVAEALRARRVYATNGPRILLRAVFAGYRMGEEVPVADGAALQAESAGLVPGVGPSTLLVQAVASSPLERIDVIRGAVAGPAAENGSSEVEISAAVSATVSETVWETQCGGLECAFVAEVADLRPGDWLYVRAVQDDDGAAWSSPFYFVAPP